MKDQARLFLKFLSVKAFLYVGEFILLILPSIITKISSPEIVMISIFSNKLLIIIVLALTLLLSYIYYQFLEYISTFFHTVSSKILIFILCGFIWFFLWRPYLPWLQYFLNSQINNLYPNVDRISFIHNTYKMPIVIGVCYTAAYLFSILSLILPNRDAATIAFAFDGTSYFVSNLGPIIYVVITLFTNSNKQLRDYFFTSVVFVPFLIYILYDTLRKYLLFSRLVTLSAGKRTATLTIVLINPMYAPYYPVVSARDLDLDKRDLSKILSSGFCIKIQRFEKLQENDLKDIVLVVEDRISYIYDSHSKTEEKINQIRNCNPGMLYRYLNKTPSQDKVWRVTMIKQQVTEQIDTRVMYLYEDTIGNALVDIVNEKDMIIFRKKLDSTIEGGEKKLVKPDSVFYKVMLVGWKDMSERTDVFSLADSNIKYFEALNHCIALVFLDALDLSVSDVINKKGLCVKIVNATFGSWKDLLKTLINNYSNNCSDTSLLKIRTYIFKSIDSEIVNDIDFLSKELNIPNGNISNYLDLLDRLVIIRNYTRGHGIYTYSYSEKMVFALSRISLCLMQLLLDLCHSYDARRLDALGWLYQEENERFLLSTYNQSNDELLFVDYYTGKIINKSIEEILE